MPRNYSTYEAKARFSEIIKLVREGRTVIVSYHGKPVAEIRPVQADSATIDERVRGLQEAGVLTPATKRSEKWKAIRRKPGALERFLEERDG
jgi:prevent-host-death family protein